MLVPRNIYCMQAKTSAKTETTVQRRLSLSQALQHHCPLGLAAVTEMFCICSVQCGGHWPHEISQAST